jgi:thiol-disulfide isomerase/thioredoxin
MRVRLSLLQPGGERLISEPFFVEDTSQEIVMDSSTIINTAFDFGYGVFLRGSVANQEYLFEYMPLFDSLNKRVSNYLTDMENCDTLKDMESKRACRLILVPQREANRDIRDSIFVKYSIGHPASPIVPWLLFEFLRNYGYKSRYQLVFNTIAPYLPGNFSKPLTAFIGVQYKKVKGRSFPIEDFIGKSNLNIVFRQNKYVLVDFWFSSCMPCIAQFNLLKDIYAKYNKNGFEIIAISIDSKSELAKYHKTLKQKQYPWRQVLDTSGIKTAIMQINSFPSTFLIDKTGKIIAEDISPAELNRFLQKNCGEIMQEKFESIK